MQEPTFTGVNAEIHLIFYFVGGYEHHIYNTREACQRIYDSWVEVKQGKTEGLFLTGVFKGLPTAIDLTVAFRAEMLPIDHRY